VICDRADETLREETFVTLTHSGEDGLQATLHGLAEPKLGVTVGRELSLTLAREADEPTRWLSPEARVPALGAEPSDEDGSVLLIPGYEHVSTSEGAKAEYRLTGGARTAEALVRLEFDVDYGGKPALRIHCLGEGSIQTYPIRLR